MKAVIVDEFGAPEKMKVKEIPVPDIDPNQVLIRTVMASVNFADIKARYGNKGAGLPFIPGLDAAGIIEKVGSEVKELKAGQRVVAFPSNGSYAEYVAANESLTYPIPDDLDFAMAAAAPTVSILAHKLLADIARLERGETVVIHSAAGGVGSTAIQMAKLLGAGMVIGTVGSKEKMAAVLKVGADEVICYEKDDFAERVNELTNGEGADIILDSLSGWVSEKSMECLAPYGRLVHFGNSTGGVGRFKTRDLHASCRSVLGYSLGTTRKKRPETLKKTAEDVLKYIAGGQITIQIGHRFKLEDVVHAHQLMESRKSIVKILLEISKQS